MGGVCGPSCWIRTAWDAPHRSFSSHEDQEHSPATRETIEQLAEQLYTPIRHWQTRVLRILPNPSVDASIECELYVATLGDKGGAGIDATGEWIQFEALSYSWGRPEFTISIKCNGLMFPTTRHFEEALRYFRYPDRERNLWTDAICINQHDLEEKGLQVQSMFNIFGKASKVLGWLGPSTDRSYQLLNFLAVASERKDKYGTGCLISEEDYGEEHDKACQPVLALLRDAMISFSNTNTWFSRTWIRQEIAAARSVDIFAGLYHFGLDTLATVAGTLGGMLISDGEWEDFSYTRGRVLLEPIYPRNFVTLVHQNQNGNWKGTRQKKTWSWSEAFFTNSEGFQASVDQDRVYALQNIVEGDVEPKDRLFPVIDYSLPAVQVYEQMVKRLVKREGGNAILSVFENYGQRSNDASLPSWVSDPRVNQPRFVGDGPILFGELGGPGPLRMRGWRVGSVAHQKPVPDWNNERKRFYLSVASYGGSHLGDPNESLSRWTWSELSQALQMVSYSFYGVEIFPEMLKCGDPCKHGKDMFATSACQPGDLVVHVGHFQYHYLLLKVNVEPPRYRFLGPCIFKSRNVEFNHRYYNWSRSRESRSVSKSATLLARVKTKLHHDCWKYPSYKDEEEFVMI